MLTTRSTGTSHSSARAHPYGCQSSCPGACASVSIVNGAARLDRQPQQPTRRVQPLRPGVDLDRDAELAAGLEHHLGVELRLRPDLAAAPPVTQPPGAVPEDVGVRVGDRGDHPAGHVGGAIRSLECTTGHDDVELGQQRGVLVERAVLEDVDLDAGEDPERRQLLVELGTTSSWRAAARR